MSAARDRNNNPYENGGGFGKFRKRPFRRAPTTPYDRPPIAIRHAANGNSGGGNNGWLSRLVDPAQRLVTWGAHRLFASVFQKRLPPPPLAPPLEPEANQGATNRQNGAVLADQAVTRAAAINGHDVASTSDRGGITELELILRQKTFTRSEIEQLTALLQSKADQPVERNSEAIPSNAVSSHNNTEELLNTPVRDKRIENHFVSTPIVSSIVLDEDVASPAELAKAYMGSRPSNVSPSSLGQHNQPVREVSTSLINPALPLKSPSMSVVPRSSGRAALPENGFVTPRSRGRSAIYSLSRIPYSRHSSTTVQGAEKPVNAFGGSSSSFQSALENRFSGSRQGALKRRSSVWDNDIGSVGPIRRIRQKSNLLPASGALSIHGTGFRPDDVQNPASTKKPTLLGEPSTENRDNVVHDSGINPIPSKSSEMASKILQQLDVLVSSREKLPSKLSPSMLRGPALRSLENIYTSKLLENSQDNSKLDLKHDTSLPDGQDTASQEQDKAEENGSMKHLVPYDLSTSAVKGVVPTSLMKNNLSDVHTPLFSVANSVAQTQKEKKRAFQMSAQEDYLELDNDDYTKEAVSAGSDEGKEKQDTALLESKSRAVDVIMVEKLQVFPQVKAPSNSILNQKTAGTFDGSVMGSKSSGLLFPAAPLSITTIQQAVVDDQSIVTPDKSALPKEPNAASPIFSFGEDVVSQKEPNGALPASNSSFPQFTFAPSTVVNEASGSELESSSSLALVSGSDKVIRKDSNSKLDNDSSKAAGFFRPTNSVPSAVSTSSPATSLFSFGTTTDTSSLNNGSHPSIPSPFSSLNPPLVSSNGSTRTPASSSSALANNATTAKDTTINGTNAASSSSFSISSSASSFGTASLFKFGSSAVPSTSASMLSPTAVGESTEAKASEASFGNMTAAPFGSTSSTNTTGSSLFGATAASSSTEGAIFAGTSAISGTGNSIFGATSAAASMGSSSFGGTSAAAPSTGSNHFSFSTGATTTAAAAPQSQGFNPFTAGTAEASAVGTSFATSTQSLPIQLGSSESALTGSTIFSTVGSLLGSASTPKLFSSGLTASTSATEANSIGSSCSATTTVFGSSWQTPKSPILGSSFNSSPSSTGFAFGASSTSNAVTSSTSMLFGSSTSAQSSSIFSFSAPAATASQPVFGNANPSFTFGSSPSNNNDQMNMEDTMAEDTVQATTPAVPVFGQQAIASPSSGFVFGSTAPSGGNQFGSTPSGANPFQFGSQPNMAATQSTSPFQASGSLEFNAGGSFSLGSGGGDKSNRKFVKVRKNPRKR